MKIRPDVSVCCVSEGRRSDLLGFLKSIKNSAGMAQVQKIVVLLGDKNHRSSIAEEIEKDHTDTIIYELDGHENRTTAMNRAMQFATGRYISCWGDGITLGADCLQNLLYFMDDTPEAGICGPRFLDVYGKILPTAWPVLSLLSLLRLLLGLGLSPRPPEYLFLEHRNISPPKEVDRLSGAGIIFRREMVEETGLFHPHLTGDGALMEICMRSKNAGWHNYYVPNAEAMLIEKKPLYTSLNQVLKYFIIRCLNIKPGRLSS